MPHHRAAGLKNRRPTQGCGNCRGASEARGSNPSPGCTTAIRVGVPSVLSSLEFSLEDAHRRNRGSGLSPGYLTLMPHGHAACRRCRLGSSKWKSTSRCSHASACCSAVADSLRLVAGPTKAGRPTDPDVPLIACALWATSRKSLRSSACWMCPSWDGRPLSQSAASACTSGSLIRYCVGACRGYRFPSILRNRVGAQQTAYSRFPDPNALQEKFYWCSVAPTLFRVKPFDEHIEGLSRCADGTCVGKLQSNRPASN